MRRPTALWVVPVADMGGVARHVLDVTTTGLPGYDLVIAAPEGELTNRLRAQGCPVVSIPVDSGSRHTVAALRHAVERLQPAVVHSHLARADFLATMATVGLPPALVSTEHHIQSDQRIFHGSAARASVRQIAHHARIRRFDRLIAVSESTRRDMLRHWHPTAPITVIRNGVDRSPARQARPGLRVLSLTRLSPEKNLTMTLRVFALVHAAKPAARLTIAGAGPQLDELRSLADSLGISDVVTFPGFVDAATALEQHDVVLQPSLADNLSYTLLDAVNAGLGVVASPIGGNDEILPARCLAPLDDDAGMAAAVIVQGNDISARPDLPSGIPTIAQMCARIVGVYDAVTATPAGFEPDPGQPADAPAPTVSVVIAFYRNDATLPAQLAALARQIDAPPFEVVIADNEGSARLPEFIAQFADRLDIRIVAADEARGQCHARNRGVANARGTLLAMCDADDMVSPTWIRALSGVLQEQDVVVTGPLRVDRLNPEFAWHTYLGPEADVRPGDPAYQLPYPFLGYERFAVGCNLGIRRASYVALGGMNPNILGGSEDVDFSWRALESGRPLRIADDAVVDYRLRTGIGEIFRQRREYQHSQLNLWSISRSLDRPVRGMSLRWAVRQTAALPVSWLRVRGGSLDERYRFAAWAGSVVGNLEGQLTERLVRRR